MARIDKELSRKDLNDPDNHDGVITHLEPDILEGEVKWAFKSFLRGTFLMAQWLRLWARNAGDLGSNPGQGTRSHMLQLKIPYAATKTCAAK